MPDTALNEVRCCSDLRPDLAQYPGWTFNRCTNQSRIWVATTLAFGPLPARAPNQTWASLNFTLAVQACANSGGRLCTAAEINDRCAERSGGGFDDDLVWTMDGGSMLGFCAAGFTDANAAVVCTQLGYSGGNAILNNTTIGGGFQGLQCTGSEQDISQCAVGVPNASCGLAGVSCSQNIRLVGGASPTEGRVEVYTRGQWGTVCDDLWGDADATVVCQQLGFGSGVARVQAAFGQGSGPIWIDNSACTGNETSLLQCGSNGIGNHNCAHSEDAGVVCSSVRLASYNAAADTLTTGTLLSGIVQHYDPGAGWSPVCADGGVWTSADATVTCRQLGLASGFNGTASLSASSTLSARGEPFSCAGGESTLGSCPRGAGYSLVVHGYCTSGSQRIFLGNFPPSSGGVSACVAAAENFAFIEYHPGNGRCRGHQGQCNNFHNCTQNPGGHCRGPFGPMTTYAVNGASCSQVAAVQCTAPNNIRLRGGPNASSGRIEVQYRGQWGTVCDDYWDQDDAETACRSLGFPGAAPNGAMRQAFFGQGTGPILLDNVQCSSGGPPNLFVCSHNNVTVHNCQHSEDAGVICNTMVRIISAGPSTTGMSGVLQVFTSGSWTSFSVGNSATARVACASMGYSGGSILTGAGSVTNPPACTGTVTCPVNGAVTSILSCQTTPVCQTYNTLSCSAPIVTPAPVPASGNGTIRLVGGQTSSTSVSGRLEIFYGGRWGTVCDDYFGQHDAAVVCRQYVGQNPSLGWTAANVTAVTHPRAFYGQGSTSQPILLDDVRCAGTESQLLSCPHRNPIGSNNCRHSEDVGVQCSTGPPSPPSAAPTPSTIDYSSRIRLANGPPAPPGFAFPSAGRLEVFIGGRWGTVCDDSFRSVDAAVVCRQLGYGGGQAVYSTFGSGTGPILMDDVNCNSSSVNLFDCHYTPRAQANCFHSEDVGIRCTTVASLPRGRIAGPVLAIVNGTEGPVCPSQFATGGLQFGDTDAQVVCRELGLAGGVATNVSNTIGQAYPTNTRHFSRPVCVGTEANLATCPNSGVSATGQCWHYQPASVQCSQSVRLCNGTDCSSGRTQGRVEVYSGGGWGTVCDDRWSVVNSKVVCGQLGLSGGTTVFNRGNNPSPFGVGRSSQRIALDDVQCDGAESSILACSARVGTHNCRHSEDIAVTCSGSTVPPNGGPPTTLAPLAPPPSFASPVAAPTFAPVRPGAPTPFPTFAFQSVPTKQPPTVPITGPPSSASVGGGGSTNSVVFIGATILVVVCLAFGVYCWARHRKGSADLPRAYRRVQNEGRVSGEPEDDDDDELIISDVQGVIDGSLEMEGPRDSVELFESPEPMEKAVHDNAGQAEDGMFEGLDDDFNPRGNDATPEEVGNQMDDSAYNFE